MSIIVDCNAAHTVNPSDENGGPIYESLISSKLTLCVGGKLTTELKSTKLWKLAGPLLAAGRLHVSNDQELNDILASLQGKIKSDDSHVLAVAINSGCRTLYSADQALHSDFTNSAILHPPRGKIYQEFNKHKRILNDCCKS